MDETTCQQIAAKLGSPWQMATRDDSRVAQNLYQGEVDRAYSLEEDALLDEFFHYLQEIGLWDELKQFKPKKAKRLMIPFVQFLLLYMLKTLFGIESINALPDLLLTDQAAMQLIGFNAYQIKNGICRRGEWKRTDSEREPISRGPIAPETLAENMAKPTPSEILGLFNRAVQLLAKWGVFPKEVVLTADATDIETTEGYEGCGKAVRKRRIRDKIGKEMVIEVVVYGWKLIVLMEQETKIPVAAKMVKIEAHESPHLMELVEQAKQNLKGYVWIKRLVIDRGFLDGEDLYRLDQMGIEFVTLGKEGMAMVEEARGLAAQAKEGKEEVGLYVAERGEQEKEKVELVGIEGLRCYDQYGPPGHEKKRYRNDFEPNLINGVVVRRWAGRDYGKGGKRIYVTNMGVAKPFAVYDSYAGRSTIENSLIKEAKQSWGLKHAPQKTEAAVINHVVMTLLVFGLVQGYRRWKVGQQGEATGLGGERWRRKLKRVNRDKVIVFSKGRYGIFDINEVLHLRGVQVRDPPEEVGGREETLKRYGISEGREDEMSGSGGELRGRLLFGAG